MLEVTSAKIEDMIRIFIHKGNKNKVLSEIFTKSIKDEDAHVKKVSSFWKYIILGEGDYKHENFNHSHEGLEVDKTKKISQEGYTLKNGIKVKEPISKVHFDNWMQCFEESARETFEKEETVLMLVNKAKEIAKTMHDIKKS